MLQTVLGLEAERIAAAFLTSPAAMSQRLVRAKTKIRDAGIPFAIPRREEWPERLDFVLDAVYAAFTIGWESHENAGLAAEAVWLARVLVQLLPDEPEALGLLALMLHCQARNAARLVDGRYIPLPEQDTALWDVDLIEQAEVILRIAARHQTLGRFQLEAAIQSIHAQRARTGEINWTAIAMMYEALVQNTLALGAQIGRAIAQGQARGPATGLALLDALPREALQSHQPYWAARAHFLAGLGHSAEARAAYTRAIGLSEDGAVRAFLISRSAALLD
jgi:predicted RNA polymerase sigma factor